MSELVARLATSLICPQSGRDSEQEFDGERPGAAG
jgi:hypothetical protein